jgi:hypothetical protein
MSFVNGTTIPVDGGSLLCQSHPLPDTGRGRPTGVQQLAPTPNTGSAFEPTTDMSAQPIGTKLQSKDE